jgi:hypothetical protein
MKYKKLAASRMFVLALVLGFLVMQTATVLPSAAVADTLEKIAAPAQASDSSDKSVEVVQQAAVSLEQAIKIPLFDCRDCGDCSLPDIAYLCPESHCAKNQRNGPCGGSQLGRCEVPDRPCIWSSAYDRLKPYGEEEAILRRPVVVTDNALRRTSAWANTYLGRDHSTRPRQPGVD